ncbi:hypothetical protein AYO21_09455 [Fonsecaea monophora]|uniref:Uncharacterized protein n=1 Tax=Fonsecaea monophora TaxID=254056 RepID=A0A177EXP0_9EURO|nr:hypothetical protein AYO21_09455 [Fonsecaea monophora]KAH0835239.1 hypothetical protein FOPE_04060 [Fonsecaea pedrosoi]OAG36376.1 hypothetical protein AYO21_09455 [Fonsecaea monophora]
MTEKSGHKPTSLQSQSTEVDLAGPKPQDRANADADAAADAAMLPFHTFLAHPRSRLTMESSRTTRDGRTHCAGSAVVEDKLTHVNRCPRAYHYFNSAYPDHSFRVEYSDDPRYPAGEYPEGAYPTDAYLVAGDEDSESEHHDGREDETDYDDYGGGGEADDDDDWDVSRRAGSLRDGDEESVDHDRFWEVDEAESVGREPLESSEGESTKAWDDSKDIERVAAAFMETTTVPECRRQGENGEICHHPCHVGAPHAQPNFTWRTLFALGACVGVALYAWKLALDQP